jgi:beta-aspartyl-peptidase (threonine type)
MRVALAIGQERLASGAPAIEIGAAVVASMDSDGAFDAGKGAVLMQNGRVELDAGLMNGESLQFGAVANIQHFLHPIAIARRILEVGRRQFSFLAGAGAEVFAEAQGFERMRNEALICERERVRFERLQWAANRYHTSDPFPMRPPAQ